MLLLTGGLAIGQKSIRDFATKIIDYFYDDPDMPSRFQTGMSKEEFMIKRSEQIAMLRGIDKDKPVDPHLRMDAIKQLENQESFRYDLPESPAKDALLAAWTEIGPNPIPNGQVQSGLQLPVSGRTIAIAVHPTNPNIVYVGTAQGGLYRTTDGGTTWTPLMDNAMSLAIGAVAIAPSQPETVYVGTGEPNFSGDSFFGVGVYRIDNASSATPILTGPLNKDAANADVFTGAAISEIQVHPTNPDMIFVSTASGIGGIGAAFATTPSLGVYRSSNATSATPTFAKLTGLQGGGSFSVRDLVLDPLNPDLLVCHLVANGGGIYVSTNATAATPSFTRRQQFSSSDFNELTGELAIQHTVGNANPTIYAAVGNGSGGVYINTDGGTTWTLKNTVNFCSPQCFYNIAIDVDPTNANNVYIGGTGAVTFSRSTNGGTNFTASQNNLHTDTHAIAVAPSLPSTIYFGSDGGIYKSIDGGTTWVSLNNTTFRATQFMSLDVHWTDPNFTIGGTQDNGTEYRDTAGVWTRADFGDGGYSVIDQSSTSLTTVNLYHTYFNASTLTGYAFNGSTATATEGNWSFRGCQGATANGITCTPTVNFYAPLVRGPSVSGSLGNVIYYGADRLYRTVDRGLNHTTVSQTFTSPISAIGISHQNDNVRIIGQNNGGIFGTSSGSSSLTDLDPSGTVPNNYISRAVIDPRNVNTAYVTLSVFGTPAVWKTTNLGSGTPTWVNQTGTGANVLPQVPINAFVVDPLHSNDLYAGTDIGVYVSSDGGLNWSPMGTGLPRVAVFDMAVTAGGLLRIATHGRGMWEIPLLQPTAANVRVAGRVTNSAGQAIRGAIVTIGDNAGNTRSVATNTFGYYGFDEVSTGQTYVVSVTSKRYRFTTRTLTVNDDLGNVDFVAIP
jgi:photosystem II stability/assembly factor-like uncharacterized protein